MHVYSVTENPAGGLDVHAVGKNSRMDVQHTVGGSWRAPTPLDDKEPSSSSSKGKDAEVRDPAPTLPPSLHRSVSQRSDSDRSEASSTPASSSRFSLADPLPSPSTTTQLDEPTSMDPPAAPRPSSRRSSTSGSQSHMSHSPALLPQGAPHRHLRSPSPAPLPAVRAPPAVDAKADNIKLYGDANSTPFFRRLCWSTDGSLLLTPAGLFEDPYGSIAKYAAESDSIKKKAAAGPPVPAKKAVVADTTPKPTVYIYSRANVARPPIAHLPGHKTTSIAIRFCPVLWELRALRAEGDEDGPRVELGTETVDVPLPGASDDRPTSRPQSLFDLPYRMVYAVATLDCVFLYDTQQAGPICVFGNLHYAPFTDLSWCATLSSHSFLTELIPFTTQTGPLTARRSSSPRRTATAPSSPLTRSSWAHPTQKPPTSLSRPHRLRPPPPRSLHRIRRRSPPSSLPSPPQRQSPRHQSRRRARARPRKSAQLTSAASLRQRRRRRPRSPSSDRSVEAARRRKILACSCCTSSLA